MIEGSGDWELWGHIKMQFKSKESLRVWRRKPKEPALHVELVEGLVLIKSGLANNSQKKEECGLFTYRSWGSGL